MVHAQNIYTHLLRGEDHLFNLEIPDLIDEDVPVVGMKYVAYSSSEQSQFSLRLEACGLGLRFDEAELDCFCLIDGFRYTDKPVVELVGGEGGFESCDGEVGD